MASERRGRGGREKEREREGEGGEWEGKEGREVKRDIVRRKGSEERQKVNENNKTNQLMKLKIRRGKEGKVD